MRNVVLELNNITCGYGKKIILHNINFSLFKKEIISIIGTNGSGKTTLLKTIAGIIKPEKGEILIKNKNIKTIPIKMLAKKTAVVMQSINSAFMTVEEYILLGRLPYFKKYQFFETQKDIELTHKYMKLTNTFKLKDAPFNKISGGEKQLVVITRALVQEPDLLLLDEPTSHLDIKHQTQIMELIIRLKQELELAVLIILHDLNLAGEYSDKLILLNKKNGKIYSLGMPREVITEKAIQDIYKTDVIVKNNPVSKKPCVFFVSKNAVPA
ncbi:MAG: cobalamin ABC transporter ATP-binding protein [Desulfobacteraceae bacterium 4572_130]|nr:MAG: cobalamin ABC transporter ATP-binding protein [Desulfobacteraceae bacterium 4572_130]